MTRTLTIAVVQAGLSTPSSTSRLADVLQTALETEARSRALEPEVTRIDLRSIAVGIMEATISPVKPAAVQRALDSVSSADVIIAVTPTFNASFSGLFKSFFDLVKPKALAGVPVMLGATGGTARHSLIIDTAMRPLFSYLRAMPVPTAIFAASADFASADDSLAARARTAAEEAIVLLGVDAPPADGAADPSGAGAGDGADDSAADGAEGSSQKPGRGISAAAGRTSTADDFTDFVPFGDLLKQMKK